MPFRVGIGFSNSGNAVTAAHQAAQAAKIKLQQDRIDVAVILHTSHYDPQEFLPLLYQELNQTRLIGCLTPGIILSSQIESAGIAVLLFYSETTKFETGHISHLSLQDPFAAGKTFIADCISGFGQSHRKAALFFLNGLWPLTEEFVLGAQSDLGTAIPIVGAGSGEVYNFQKSYTYYQDQTLSSGACGMLLGETVKGALTCQHGWKPLGKPRSITAAEGNIIKTIDGEPAVNLYRKFFDDPLVLFNRHRLDRTNLRYPLGIRANNQSQYILRNIISMLDDGSIVCQDKVTIGSKVHIMIGNQHSCQLSAEQAAYQVREQLAGLPPKLIIIIESVMRKTLLGRLAAQEVQTIKNILGASVPVFGMYSLKEIFRPVSAEKALPPEIHNSSLLLIALG